MLVSFLRLEQIDRAGLVEWVKNRMSGRDANAIVEHTPLGTELQ